MKIHQSLLCARTMRCTYREGIRKRKQKNCFWWIFCEIQISVRNIRISIAFCDFCHLVAKSNLGLAFGNRNRILLYLSIVFVLHFGCQNRWTVSLLYKKPEHFRNCIFSKALVHLLWKKLGCKMLIKNSKTTFNKNRHRFQKKNLTTVGNLEVCLDHFLENSVLILSIFGYRHEVILLRNAICSRLDLLICELLPRSKSVDIWFDWFNSIQV